MANLSIDADSLLPTRVNLRSQKCPHISSRVEIEAALDAFLQDTSVSTVEAAILHPMHKLDFDMSDLKRIVIDSSILLLLLLLQPAIFPC